MLCRAESERANLMETFNNFSGWVLPSLQRFPLFAACTEHTLA